MKYHNLFPFLSGSARTAGQESVDGWTGYSLKYGQKDVPQIWPNYPLFCAFLCKTKKWPNLGHVPAGEACGDLCGGYGLHLRLLCLRHRKDEQSEVWITLSVSATRIPGLKSTSKSERWSSQIKWLGLKGHMTSMSVQKITSSLLQNHRWTTKGSLIHAL